MSDVLITVDVDAFTPMLDELSRSEALTYIEEIEQRMFGLRFGIPRILEALKEREIKATFFVPGIIAEEFPEIVASISAFGHEIGLHGWRHTPPRLQTSEEIMDEIQESITALQTAGVPQVHGYRAPEWQMTRELLNVLNASNLLYDSSMAGSEAPYLLEGRKTPLVELPVSWALDDAPYLLCTSRSFLRPVSGQALGSKWCHDIAAIARFGGTSTLTVHPWLIGRGSAITALEAVLDYINDDSDIWSGTASELIQKIDLEELLCVDPVLPISSWESP